MLISSYHALMCDYDNITSGKFSLAQVTAETQLFLSFNAFFSPFLDN